MTKCKINRYEIDALELLVGQLSGAAIPLLNSLAEKDPNSEDAMAALTFTTILASLTAVIHQLGHR